MPFGVLVAPILPGLSVSPEQLDGVVKACADAGAVSITGFLLHLCAGVRDHHLGWLTGARPDLVERYVGLYPRAHAPTRDEDELTAQVNELVVRHGGRSGGTRLARSVPPKPASPPAPGVSQLRLGM